MNDSPESLGRRGLLRGLAGGAVLLGLGGGAGLLGAGEALASEDDALWLGDSEGAVYLPDEDESAFSERSGTLAVSQPRIYTDAEWGAKPPTERIVILNHRPKYLVIHHMAYPNTSDYSKAHAFDLARRNQADHIRRGYGDTGQQFTTTRGGFLLEGRHESLVTVRGGKKHVQGANVANHNSQIIGIENEGTYTSVLPPAKQYNALVSLCAWICHQYAIPVSNIKGHRDFNSTECPGNALYRKLPQLRKDVQKHLR